MRLLPQLSTLPAARLPLCDASAAVLVDLLLVGDRPRVRRELAEAIALDPPLALWCAVQAAADASPPRSVADVADWLADRAAGVLRWPVEFSPGATADSAGDTAASAVRSGTCDGGEADVDRSASMPPPRPGGPTPPARQRERFADAAAAAVQVATLAARLAEEGLHPLPADAAYLAGLVASAAESFLGGSAAQVRDLLAEREIAAACVARALTILSAASAPPPELKLKRRELDRLRGQVRHRWLATGERAAEWLPALTVRLAEIEELRAVRQERLEVEKLESLAEFAAGAGHEINNPLAVISGRAQLLLRDEADPERRRDLAIMHVQAMRVHEMIADLMLFARPPLPRPGTFDLAPLLAALAEELAPDLALRDTSLALSCPTPLVLSADGGQLLVALRALCDNALDAIGRGGRIDIAARRAGDEVLIVVRDNGPGIPPEVRRHLFDPYYSGRSSGRGLGLGLAKCWRIVDQHGGRIEVADAGPGAVFTLALPASTGGMPVEGT